MDQFNARSRLGKEDKRLITMAKTFNDSVPVAPTKVVGGFGIVESTGYVNYINWVVSDRPDKRHGNIDKQRGHYDRYWAEVQKTLFRKW